MDGGILYSADSAHEFANAADHFCAIGGAMFFVSLSQENPEVEHGDHLPPCSQLGLSDDSPRASRFCGMNRQRFFRDKVLVPFNRKPKRTA